ncbi:MAG: phenylalanine--tRNA ligase subunit beta, partial [Patescibacteria group bacterium]
IEIDNKSLTHRSDLFSHIGFARELGAVYNKKVKFPKLKSPKERGEKKLEIKVEDFDDCHRYMAIVLDNIKIKESPKWMQNRLAAVGFRPINNVVDITNYLMLEYGHPTHAFDYDKISGGLFNIRRAKIGEEITTLDNENRKLDGNMLIIEDQEKITDLAGVMGGQISEIDEKTKTMVLEAANFNKTLIRKTANKLDLRTEASLRFEKGLSLDLTRQVFLRGVELLEKYADAKVVSKLYDEKKNQDLQDLLDKEIVFELDYIKRLIGKEIPVKKIEEILTSLEFKVKKSKNNIKVLIPLHRTDINIPEDVIEEIARIYGYNNIESEAIITKLAPPEFNKEIFWGRRIKDILVDLGFTHVMNYSFYGDRELRNLEFSPEDHVELENPLSDDQKYLRATLLAGLLNNVEQNLHVEENPKLFEIGHVYYPDLEITMVGGVIVGNSEDVFYEAKGFTETMLEKLNIKYQFESISKREEQYAKFWKLFLKRADTKIVAGNKTIGTLSLLNPEILLNFNISALGSGAEKNEKFVVYFNFWKEELMKMANTDIKYKPLPKYPVVSIDLAVVLDLDIEWIKVQQEIRKANKLIKEIELFDVYTGKSVPEDKKSFAMHLKFQSDEKTLEMEEVEKFREDIMNKLNKKFNAIIRK